MSDVVVEYRNSWPDVFAAERERLVPVLAAWLTDGVHHIGSTAIPGMSAKPVVDMMAGVRSLRDARAAGPTLASLGYLARPHRVDAVLYVREPAGGAEGFSLQVTTSASALWTERLTFRDAVRADPDLAARYRELKQTLVRRRGGRIYDAADKREFVRGVLAGAGHRLRDDRHVPVTREDAG